MRNAMLTTKRNFSTSGTERFISSSFEQGIPLYRGMLAAEVGIQ